MELSGRLIKGTGEYIVNSISPISEKGQLLVNGGFATTASWTTGTGWAIGSGALNGIASTGNAYQLNVVTIGKYYSITFDIINYASGSVRIAAGATGIGTTRNSNGTYTEIIQAAGDAQIYIDGVTAFTGSIDNVSVEEVPEGYPLLDAGDKYLECTSAGTVAWSSTVAYGEWEFDWYNDSLNKQVVAQFINSKSTIWTDTNNNEYAVMILGGVNSIRFYRGANILLSTAASYIAIQTWYRIKITRTKDGQFYVYIKGGAFGDTWTLVSVTGGSGTNPVTDNTYTTSQYFVLDLDAGDKVTSPDIKSQVKQ